MNVLNIIEEKKQLEKQIKSINSELSQLPEKDFFCAKNGTSFKWFETDGKIQTYIKKEQRAYAEKLAKRKYLLAKKKDLSRELKALELYLKYHKTTEGEAAKLISNPGYAALLSTYLNPISYELQEWKNTSYVRNESHPETLIHKAGEGLIVRSKSEVLIALQLRMKQIPFRYECLLPIGNIKFFPDFTTKHPKTGRTYYWEHFGMMDEEDYSNHAFSKLKTYAQNGIIPGVNLIMTFETKDHPLEVGLVEKIIDYYFT